MKKIISVLVMVMCLTSVVKAQIYGSEVYYYVPAGENITQSTTVEIVYFDGRVAWFGSDRCSNILNQLNSNSSYFLNKAKKDLRNPDEDFRVPNRYRYDSSISTSTKKVYKFVDTYWTGVAFGGRNTSGYCYYAVSNDKETLIYWYENTSNEIRDKKYYTRVDVKDLAPKPANRDFLYE